MATHPLQPDCDDRVNHPARNIPGAPNCSSARTTPASPWWTRHNCTRGAPSTHHGATYQICGECDNATQAHPTILQARADLDRVSPQPQPPLWGAAGGIGQPNTWTALMTRLCSSCSSQERMKYWNWCHNYGGPDEDDGRHRIGGGTRRATAIKFVDQAEYDPEKC